MSAGITEEVAQGVRCRLCHEKFDRPQGRPVACLDCYLRILPWKRPPDLEVADCLLENVPRCPGPGTPGHEDHIP